MNADAETGSHPSRSFVLPRGQTDEIIEGFDSRADDYIVKPFVNSELRARVEGNLASEAGRRMSLQAANRKLHEAYA
jgi:DNA-binding response OmpR family regulator